MIFFHCSDKASHDIGTVFRGRGDAYEASWARTDFYAALEAYRPEDRIAHKDAVFVCRDLESLFLCGGGEESILLLETSEDVSWHDMNWSSEISGLISEGYGFDSQEVRDAADAYWAGLPHPNESVWEGITKSAKVVAVFDFNEDDEVLEKAKKRMEERLQKRSFGLSP
jgi:hypothetical protein